MSLFQVPTNPDGSRLAPCSCVSARASTSLQPFRLVSVTTTALLLIGYLRSQDAPMLRRHCMPLPRTAPIRPRAQKFRTEKTSNTCSVLETSSMDWVAQRCTRWESSSWTSTYRTDRRLSTQECSAPRTCWDRSWAMWSAPASGNFSTSTLIHFYMDDTN